ncbi:MAG: diacylglycerol kinase family protein [Deltaproteobacteria bacterium]|nr:diacylglycerol kinase family protein [Deltaproteobacteria bacterium]
MAPWPADAPRSSFLVTERPVLPSPRSPEEPTLPPLPAELPPQQQGVVASLGHALDGLLDALDGGRNMKVHVVAGLLVAMVGSGIQLKISEQVALLLSVGLVIAAEAFNTALEAVVDLATREIHEKARLAKDVAASAVLVLSVLSAVVLSAVVVAEWPLILQSGSRIGLQVAAGVPLAACAALLLRRYPRPAALDAVWVGVGCLLLLLLATWSASAPFTALAVALFVACAATARRRRSRRLQSSVR